MAWKEKDRDRAREYWREWYYKNRRHYNILKNKIKYKNARLKKTWIIEKFGGRCHMCGHSYPNIVFDIHHVNGKTAEDNTQVVYESWERIKRKMPRLMLLCANCHRIKHLGKEGS